jgi:RHS repeat-associated protein
MTVSGQSPVSYTYDATARLRTITQAPLNPVDLQYDAANRRTLLTLPNGVSTEYQYDEASRLVALIYRNALGPLGDLTYGYDAGGNRIATGGSFARTLVPEAVTTATYDAGNRQLAFGSNTQTFDDNGNLLTRTDGSGTTTYTWDARNRLTGLTGSSLAASFAYDGLGRRAQKTVNSVLTQFRYDGLDAVAESGGGNDATYLRTLSIDEALVRTEGTDTAHYLGDALGSSVALANAGGTTATTYTYAPFGETTTAGTPSSNAFRFTGREDDATGLSYYRARYYDPTRSRFVSEDPLGLTGGDVNLYAIVRNDPVDATDPFGLLNPTKAMSALANAGIAGWTGGVGIGKLAIAAGLLPAAPTGVGALPSTALTAWGLWNLKSSVAAWGRAQQQWSEAMCEDWSDWSWKNFWGVVPGGTGYDDPGEPDYIRDRAWWKHLRDAGYF